MRERNRPAGPDVYYFFEVYRDEAALEAHRAGPHYAISRQLRTRWMAHPGLRALIDTVFPAAAEHWETRRSSG